MRNKVCRFTPRLAPARQSRVTFLTIVSSNFDNIQKESQTHGLFFTFQAQGVHQYQSRFCNELEDHQSGKQHPTKPAALSRAYRQDLIGYRQDTSQGTLCCLEFSYPSSSLPLHHQSYIALLHSVTAFLYTRLNYEE
jgi:hypothetical protein